MSSEDIIKVWDVPLRIFHWLLVVAFFVAYFTEDELLAVHVWAGYVVSGLLVFRIFWGFTGNEYARFSQFVCRPAVSIAYLKDLIGAKAKRYIGHNPAGAAMIVLLLLSLTATVMSGLAVYGATKGVGLFAFIYRVHDYFWEIVHEFFANVTLVLVFVHVLGVVVESIIHRESLVKAMIHGNKKKL